MTDVMEILAASKLDLSGELVPPVDDVWRKLHGAAEGRTDPRRSTRATGRWWTRSAMRWAVGGVAAAVGVLVVLVVGTSGSGPARAFAGWSATPTTPLPGEVAAADAGCHQAGAPTLADTRGPFALLLFSQPGEPIFLCTSFPAATGQEFAGGNPSSPSAGDIPPTSDAIIVAARLVRTDASNDSAYGILYGYTGDDVTSVSLVLDDGSEVQATTESGLFAAWWPGTQGIQSAEITTGTGTTVTQALDIGSAPPGLGTGAPMRGQGSTAGVGDAGATVSN